MRSEYSADNQYGDTGFTEAGFEAFFKTHYPRLCVYCKFKFGFELQFAEDLVNTSFIKLWEARRKLADADAAKSYLYKIVDNLSLNLLKHQQVEQRYLKFLVLSGQDVAEQTNFDSIDLKELRDAIEASVSSLPEQMRKVFELSRYEGMKYVEIAHKLNISVKTVETHMSRALASLREKLSAYLMLVIILSVSIG